ncbi:MAG TPA: serine/threonine-protein kinase [Lacipirellulaceae bacterium]|nr:serine/threonine-protein kinase [Lacipirellulaceae bacterium]
MPSVSEHNAALEDVIAEYLLAIDSGDEERMSGILAAYPRHRSSLLKFLAAENKVTRAVHWQMPLATEVDGLARLDRFEISRVLGAGSFGVVYPAYDTVLRRLVALKIPLPQVLSDSESRRRFEVEAAASAGLQHDGIVAVYEANVAGPTPYIVSAYCAGPNLAQWLTQCGRPLCWESAVRLMIRLADAVHFAHQAQVYHRDIKPSNVLLKPRPATPAHSAQLDDYDPQLTDFGLAKCAHELGMLTNSSVLLGTPLYMAPELFESARVPLPVRSDIYSLGCMLYELVAGKLPVSGDSYAAIVEQVRNREPQSLRRVAPHAPNELSEVCDACLQKNPLARYESAAALAHDLRACLDRRPIAASKPSLRTRFRYWLTRPQRVLDAGLYTISVQTLLIVWLCVSVVSAFAMGILQPAEKLRVGIELTVLVLAVHLPMAVVGWFTVRGRPWSVHAGLWLSAINFAAPLVFMLLPVRLFFADIYAKVDNSGFLALAVCSLVLLAELGQVLLYALARKATSRHTETK